MSEQAKDGGSAFPRAEMTFIDRFDHGLRERVMDEARGMTLRDYFAAHALAGLLANSSAIGQLCKMGLDGTAEGAYNAADHMLAERAK